MVATVVAVAPPMEATVGAKEVQDDAVVHAAAPGKQLFNNQCSSNDRPSFQRSALTCSIVLCQNSRLGTV